MRKTVLTSLFLLLCVLGYSQDDALRKRFSQIPPEYLSHPELGKTKHSAALHEVDYELVQQRTKYSRTFLNTNTTKTMVQSSVPLHYQRQDGHWYSIDYKFANDAGRLSYPVQNPFFEIGAADVSLNVENRSIKLKQQERFVFAAADGTVLRTLSADKKKPSLVNDSEAVCRNIAPDVDKEFSLYGGAMKYTYTINSASVLASAFDKLYIEQTLSLPPGFSIAQQRNRIAIKDEKGNEALAFEQPIATDSKITSRTIKQTPFEGDYALEKLSGNTYTLKIQIDGSWLRSPERVFPIRIDPVVTLTNNNVVNSCFAPNYQQAALQVNVPAGETVLSTNINYDFVAVAGSGAWIADQRSYVSGPAGQTAVQNGVGNTAGLYTYSINDSTIGNVVSTGQITYTFNFSRNWGGSGCDAAFNFVNKREVSVTYGTIVFGNGPLVINEYSASNRYFNDGFGRNEDWIELYNTSADTYFNLAGYYLSNNINNPTKWQIQDGIVPPHSKVLVFCSSRNISSGTTLHAGFDLTQTDPDEIVIADPSGNVIESHVMFTTQTNHSYGRTTDGASTWSVFAMPTPGTANANGSSNYATKPTMSIAPGKYAGPVSVALASSGTNEQIRYTLNGSTPTAASALYSGPISVSANTVVRARAFSTVPGILPGFIETNTYFINDNSTLPVVSLAGDADLMQLLAGNQIEPTGYFEYFEADGTFVDENMGDFDKHGNDSWAYDQRGIDFISRDDHGYKRRLEHQFFNTTDRTNFRRLILKAAGSDNYPHQSGGAHLRDVFVQKISEMAGLELDERRSNFISLFVNGQYWGVYDMREKVDDNQYTDYYYGQDYLYRDSDQYIQYIKTWGSTLPEFGNQPAIDAWDDLMAFVQDNNMALEANYNYVDSQLNIDSLIDYFVLNSYMVNKDWLNWNTSWWRGLDPSGGALKWRYALWDCDGVLGHYINYTGIPDITANADPCNVEALEVGVGHAQTIEKLITESPIVRQRYISRYADLLNTHLSCEHVTQVFDSIVNVIAPEMPRQIQRWGGSMAQWQANIQSARNFLLTRCSQTIATGMQECYDVTGPYETIFNVVPANSGKIKMNSEWLETYPYTAQVFGNLDTLLKAEALTGYQFDHWVVDGTAVDPNDTSLDIALQISQATNVTAYFTEVTNAEQALYYWHFNTLDTPVDVTVIAADYNLIAGATPVMTYTGSGPRDIDANNNGSILNTHFDEVSGKCARVRNPSDGRSIVFDLPTTGYKDIKFAYAVQRTNEGQLANHISYSVDGSNFTEAGLAQTIFNVSTDFSLVALDFSALTAVNNNANFKIRIGFEGNTTGDSGNNRIDNVTLKGTQQLSLPTNASAMHQVFPNPFSSTVHIVGNETILELVVADMLGKKIWGRKNVNAASDIVDLAALNAGVYLLKVTTAGGTKTHKLVKQ